MIATPAITPNQVPGNADDSLHEFVSVLIANKGDATAPEVAHTIIRALGLHTESAGELTLGHDVTDLYTVRGTLNVPR